MAKSTAPELNPFTVARMERYKRGDMKAEEIVEFFQQLIDLYPLDELEGEFKRTAITLIAFGACRAK